MNKTSSHDSASSAKPWVDGLTIGEALDRTVERVPDNDAVVFPKLGLRWSWRELSQHVDDAARGFIALGLKKGDHAAIWSTNVPQWVVMQFATAKLGVVLVTINPAYRPMELKYVLRQSNSKALVLTDRFKTSDYYAMLSEACPEAAGPRGKWRSKEFPQLQHVITLSPSPLAGGMTFDEMISGGKSVAASAVEQAQRALEPGEPINIQYTSGTTGFPKAAMLSHRNLLMNAWYSGLCQELTSSDRICIPVPFYHCFGCVLGTLMCAVHGSAMIVPAEFFNPTDTLAAIEKERATALYGVPTMFIAQLQDPTFEGRDLSSLRTGIMAGSPCPIEIMRQVIERMGARSMTIGYGLTEASPIITQTRPDDSLERRVETVGRTLPGVEVKIVDPATGETLSDNQSGELCARGHVVMLGYYGDPEATRAAIDSEGWLHSGDLALRLPSGHYRITGRKKDMVIRGGENISPREIEEFLFTHPAIEQAAVIGVPDEKFGEELCVWVKLKAGAQLDEHQVRSFCKEHLAHYKTPRYVKFVDAFPQTVTGKIQKFKIRELMTAELGLKQAETA
jgi:fatty-acyl-CoA synthase